VFPALRPAENRVLQFRFVVLLCLVKLTFVGTISAQVPDRSRTERRPAHSANPGITSNQTAAAPATSTAYAAEREMLNRAYIAMNLRNGDSPPFHLLARFRHQEGGKTLEGTYELLWAGRQHFRETFSAGGEQEINVALDNRIYVTRTSVAVTLPLRNVRELVASPVPGNLMVDYDVTNVTTEQKDGATLTCVHAVKSDTATSQQATEQACFDSTSRQIVSLHAEGNLRNTPMKVQLDAFKVIGVKRYPAQMSRTVEQANMPSASTEVTIETLEDVKQFDGNPFVPPAGAEARDWCLTLGTPPPFDDSGRPMFSPDEIAKLSEFFVLVGADGKVKESAPVRVDIDPAGEQKIQSWLKRARFPIQNCGTEPVEYETFYTPQRKRAQ